MYSYNHNVSPYHRKLIEKAIFICNKLNVPISDSLTLGYCHGCSYVGQCRNDTKTIVIDDRLQERAFIETTIHELLHTIDNKKSTPHNGSWKKWAKYISDNTDYYVTAQSFGALSIIQTIPQNKEMQEKTDNKRHKCIKEYLHMGQFSLETLLSYLPLANKSDTREIIKTVLQNFKFDLILAQFVKDPIRADKHLMDQVVQNYCAGKYENTILTPESRVAFDSLFVSTDKYITVSAHTNHALEWCMQTTDKEIDCVKPHQKKERYLWYHSVFWPARRDSLRRKCCGYTPTGSATVHRKVAVLQAKSPFSNPFVSLETKKKAQHLSVLPFLFGPPEGIRTPVLQNRNLLRYPAAPRTDIKRANICPLFFYFV